MKFPKSNKPRAALASVLALILGSIAAGPRFGSVEQGPATAARNASLLMGQVVDAGDSRPIAGALVTLEPAAASAPAARAIGSGQQLAIIAASRRVLTDQDGHFVFDDLPKGSYNLTASKPGYLDGAFGRRQSASPPMTAPRQEIDLAEGQRLTDLRIVQWKHGVISGTVADESGEPMVGVSVRAMQRVFTGGHPQFVSVRADTTDDRGIYRIASLSPGDYVVGIAVTQSTVPAGLIDARQSGSPSIDSVGAANVGVSMASLSRPGTRIGDFVVQSTTLSLGAAPVPVNGARFPVYPTTFSGGARTGSQASTLHIAAGETVIANLALRPVSSVRVSGLVTVPDGPLGTIGLRLTPADADATIDTSIDVATTITTDDGAFTFIGVPAGEYVLRGYRATPGGGRGSGLYTSTLWGSQSISIGSSDVTGITLGLRNGYRIRGHLEFDGASARPAADVVTALAIAVDRADGKPTSGPGFSATFAADGQIATNELPPDRYYVRFIPRTTAAQTSGWSLKSATLGGRDLSATPFLLQGDLDNVIFTLTDHPTQLAGTVRDTQDRPDPDASVLVFPQDPSAWIDTGVWPRRLQFARVSRSGSYTIANLPAGDYFVVSVDAAPVADWQDPKFLQSLMSGAASLKLTDGERKTLDLKTVKR